MSVWSDKWNKLPIEIRKVGSMCETEMRINQLEIEKDRLKRRYEQSVGEINAHIRSLQDWIKRETTQQNIERN